MLTAAAVLIEAEIQNLIQACTCREGIVPCPVCIEAERLDHLGRQIAGTGGQV
jgi:hypothetical protein